MLSRRTSSRDLRLLRERSGWSVALLASAHDPAQTITSHSTAGSDLADPSLFAAGVPQDLFAERREAGAVHRNPPTRLPQTGEVVEFWSVVRHEAIQSANRDTVTFSSLDGVGLGVDTAMSGHMLTSMDAPKHTAMRGLISAGFTPRMVERLEGLIEVRAGRILADAQEREECDFVEDIAYQLPMHVIADIVGI